MQQVKVNDDVFPIARITKYNGQLLFVSYRGEEDIHTIFYSSLNNTWTDVNDNEIDVELLAKEGAVHA